MRCPTCENQLTSRDVCPKCDRDSNKGRWEIKVEVPRQDIVDAARTAIGWPFRHRGRGPEGIDCIGLLLYVSEKTGLIENLNLPDYYKTLNYSRLPTQQGPDSKWLLRELGATAKRISTAKIQKGDIVFCRNAKWVHVGIVTPDTIVHAYAFPQMQVLEHAYDQKWKKATVCAFSWPGAV